MSRHHHCFSEASQTSQLRRPPQSTKPSPLSQRDGRCARTLASLAHAMAPRRRNKSQGAAKGSLPQWLLHCFVAFFNNAHIILCTLALLPLSLLSSTGWHAPQRPHARSCLLQQLSSVSLSLWRDFTFCAPQCLSVFSSLKGKARERTLDWLKQCSGKCS